MSEILEFLKGPTPTWISLVIAFMAATILSRLDGDVD